MPSDGQIMETCGQRRSSIEDHDSYCGRLRAKLWSAQSDEKRKHVLSFARIAEDLQYLIGNKMNFIDFVQFQISSKLACNVAKKLNEPSVCDVYSVLFTGNNAHIKINGTKSATIVMSNIESFNRLPFFRVNDTVGIWSSSPAIAAYESGLIFGSHCKMVAWNNFMDVSTVQFKKLLKHFGITRLSWQHPNASHLNPPELEAFRDLEEIQFLWEYTSPAHHDMLQFRAPSMLFERNFCDDKTLNSLFKVLQLLTTEEHVLLSIDTFDEQTGIKALDPETYHGVTPSGYPPHRLTLKVGAIVILLRNINVALGLSNGTRLRVTKIGRDVLHLEHIEKRKKGENKVLLQRMLFAQDGKDLACEITFTRKQFPMRLAFCITCNRAQGQTLNRAGLILRSPCFSHGQLYVARVRTRKDLFIYNGSTDTKKTNNVTFSRVFSIIAEKIPSFSFISMAKTLKTIVLPTNPCDNSSKALFPSIFDPDIEVSDDEMDEEERQRIYLQLHNERRLEQEFEVEDFNPEEESTHNIPAAENKDRARQSRTIDFDLGRELPAVWRPDNRPAPKSDKRPTERSVETGSDMEYDELFAASGVDQTYKFFLKFFFL